MLTEPYRDSFYKNLADNLVYNNYTLTGFGRENCANYSVIEFEIILSLIKVNDDKLIITS